MICTGMPIPSTWSAHFSVASQVVTLCEKARGSAGPWSGAETTTSGRSALTSRSGRATAVNRPNGRGGKTRSGSRAGTGTTSSASASSAAREARKSPAGRATSVPQGTSASTARSETDRGGGCEIRSGPSRMSVSACCDAKSIAAWRLGPITTRKPARAAASASSPALATVSDASTKRARRSPARYP